MLILNTTHRLLPFKKIVYKNCQSFLYFLINWSPLLSSLGLFMSFYVNIFSQQLRQVLSVVLMLNTIKLFFAQVFTSHKDWPAEG